MINIIKIVYINHLFHLNQFFYIVNIKNIIYIYENIDTLYFYALTLIPQNGKTKVKCEINERSGGIRQKASYSASLNRICRRQASKRKTWKTYASTKPMYIRSYIRKGLLDLNLAFKRVLIRALSTSTFGWTSVIFTEIWIHRIWRKFDINDPFFHIFYFL